MSPDLQGDNSPAVIGGRSLDSGGDGADALAAGVGGEYLGGVTVAVDQPQPHPAQRRGRGVRGSHQRNDAVDQRGRHEWSQLCDGPASVDDLQHPAQRRVGEDDGRTRRQWFPDHSMRRYRGERARSVAV